MSDKITMCLRPIGVLRTPWRRLEDCPRNGRQPVPAPVCTVEVFPEFSAGLESLWGFSHLVLLYWLDHVSGTRLTFTPPFDKQQRGVFASRAPWRPNPIGLTVTTLEGADSERRLAVRFLDCIDGTPLLDIKPYLPTTDSEPAASMGWLAPYATRRGGSET